MKKFLMIVCCVFATINVFAEELKCSVLIPPYPEVVDIAVGQKSTENVSQSLCKSYGAPYDPHGTKFVFECKEPSVMFSLDKRAQLSCYAVACEKGYDPKDGKCVETKPVNAESAAPGAANGGQNDAKGVTSSGADTGGKNGGKETTGAASGGKNGSAGNGNAVKPAEELKCSVLIPPYPEVVDIAVGQKSTENVSQSLCKSYGAPYDPHGTKFVFECKKHVKGKYEVTIPGKEPEPEVSCYAVACEKGYDPKDGKCVETKPVNAESAAPGAANGGQNDAKGVTSSGADTGGKNGGKETTGAASGGKNGSAGNGNAVKPAEENDLCITIDEKLNKNDLSKIVELRGNPYSYATVYFDTDKNVVSQKCSTKVNEAVAALKNKMNDVEQLVFVGSADEQGNVNYNKGLSKQRVENISKMFDCNDSRCAKFVTGDVNANQYSDKSTTNKLGYRTVDIFVIWKLPVCTDYQKNRIAEINTAINDYNGSEKQQVKSILAELQKYCANGANKLTTSESEAYTNKWAELNRIILKIKLSNPSFPIDMIDTTYNALILAQQGFGISKWRTAEGEFNKSRLVSDSVAGVVLGTAGGLITSNLVKKSQIKSGFEDIQCTIGGQRVASWHDEFTVGVQ